MSGKFEVAIPLFVAALLFSAQVAYAGDSGPIISIDFDGVIRAITNSGNSITSAVNESARATTAVTSTLNMLPEILLKLFIEATKSALRSANSAILGAFAFFLENNPDISKVKPAWDAAVAAVSTLYVLFFAFAGIKFALSGENVHARESAKEWLKNSFKLIVCVAVSFEAYKMVLAVFSAITAIFLTEAKNTFIDTSFFSGAGIILLLIYLISIAFAAFAAFLRSLLLLVATPLIPFAIVLYFIPATRGWGNLIFGIIFACLIMQIFDAVIFSAAATLAESTLGTFSYIFVFPMTFFAISIANTAIFIFAILHAALTNPAQAVAQNISVFMSKFTSAATK